MISGEPIGWVNTGLPLLILAVLALVLPRLFASRATRSQRSVSVSILISSICLLICGAAVFAGVYGYRGAGVGAALGEAPFVTALFFLRLSAMAALLWGPVLALVWFGLAQGVEARRGEDIMRGSR